MGKYQLRNLRHVPRWTVVPTIQKQNVAEHNFFVVRYTSMLCDLFGAHTHDRLMALECAIEHDDGELFTGDIASPVSQAFPVLKDYMKEQLEEHLGRNSKDKYTFVVRRIVKLADWVEAFLFLADERAMGNGLIRQWIFDYVKEGMFKAYHEIDPQDQHLPQFMDMIMGVEV